MANEPGSTEISRLTRSNLAKHTNEVLRSMARKDLLTGLKNKKALEEEWKPAQSLLKRGELKYKFLFLDLDKFKPINDIDESHALGDEVLRKVGETLRKISRPEDTEARVGGDEFAVLRVGNEPEDNQKIQEQFEERFKKTFQEIAGEELLSRYPQLRNLGISVGVAEPENTDTFDSIYKRADSLMYARKAKKGQAR